MSRGMRVRLMRPGRIAARAQVLQERWIPA